MSGNLRTFLPLLLLLHTGCQEPPVELPTVPGPQTALRAEGLRGSMPPEVRITDYLLDAHLDAEEHFGARLW